MLSPTTLCSQFTCELSLVNAAVPMQVSYLRGGTTREGPKEVTPTIKVLPVKQIN